MKIQMSILIFLLLLGCKREEDVSKSKLQTKNTNYKAVEIKERESNRNSEITQNLIIGIWTDGSTENATFEITSESIYYVDDFKDYSYKLKGDTIEIKYPDYIYRAKVSFRNDTLIMNSKDYSQAKYWQFKE